MSNTITADSKTAPECEFVKFVNVHFSTFFAFPIHGMKRKTTRKYIN